MKIPMALGLGFVLMLGGCGGTDDAAPEVNSTVEATPVKETKTALVTLNARQVEIGCGLCIYGMPDVNQCMTAAMVDGEPLLVAGVDFDAHEHGLCSGPAQAVISGAVRNGELVATSLEVAEEEGGG